MEFRHRRGLEPETWSQAPVCNQSGGRAAHTTGRPLARNRPGLGSKLARSSQARHLYP